MGIEDELREILQDRDRFMSLADQFIARACEDSPNDTERYDDDFNEFYRRSVRAIVEANAAEVFEKSGSPIETIFLNSLILGFIKCDSLGLVMHPVVSDAEKEIDAFREYFSKFHAFVAWYGKEFSSFEDIEGYLDGEVEKGKMDPGERQYIERLMVRYHYLPLHDSYHLTLQPPFPNLRVDGKPIRPDMLFWIPTKPQVKIIVECDGFDYHSDKEKFISDRKRDRALQNRGYRVLRYAGSEIHKNPAGITADLAHILWGFVEEPEGGQP